MPENGIPRVADGLALQAGAEKIPVGISSCLLGEPVRYDGGHKHDALITGTLGKVFEFRSFCPEVEIGLGVPREPIQLVGDSGTTRCVGTRDVHFDVTDRLRRCADAQQSWQSDICGYIFKQNSPSCGVAGVKVWRNGQPEPDGTGIYAARVRHNFPDLPVTEEGRLGDADLRGNFIERVFIYRRWWQLMQGPVDRVVIGEFHASHVTTMMSHDPERAHRLDRWLAGLDGVDTATMAREYLSRLMRILEVVAIHEIHANSE